MKIALCSDLHLEFSDIILTNDEAADVLILSGDIMVAQDLHDHPEPISALDKAMVANSQGMGRRQETAQRFRDFLKRCSFQFPKVIYVAGNHEFYHGKYPDGYEWLRGECSKFPNIHFLEMDTVTINDFTFIGGTLWTNMNKQDPLTLHMIENMMNDFKIVRNSERNYARFSSRDAVIRHMKTLNYIKDVVENDATKKYVFVGHHTPSPLSIHPKYQSEYIMNGAYTSDLSEFILDHPQIKLWTHGHTHEQFDYVIGETRVVCNPRGYHGYEECADNFKLKFLDI
jgi:Icc-related predicted phosphoesterase